MDFSRFVTVNRYNHGLFFRRWANYFHQPIIVITTKVTSQNTIQGKYINFQTNESTNITAYTTCMIYSE